MATAFIGYQKIGHIQPPTRKFIVCDTTWNSTIYSRITPQSISPALLEKFHANDSKLAGEYAMDVALLRRNGARVVK